MNRYLFTLLLLTSFCRVFSQPIVTFDTVVTGLSSPVDVEEVNDSSHRLFIVEQTGTIRIWNGTELSPTPFLDITSKVTSGQEQGLLSVAFHPDYLNNGFFYIYYTNKSGDITIARYSRNTADAADSTSGVILMTIPKPFANHNGGNLIFGSDEYLYFATGDGGGAGDQGNNAQNGASLLGKMIRIDVNNPDPPYYSIPPDNPFAASTTTKPEIIGLGLRNPWRWSFDKQTGSMWIADVGQDAWEEVDVVKKDSLLNKNFGWHCLEGMHVYNGGCKEQVNNVFPVFEYDHNNATGGRSITGGYVYRGEEYPSLKGFYLCADFISANGWLVNADGNSAYSSVMQKNWPVGISSFGETANGTMYALTLSGTLYKVVAGSTLAVHVVNFKGAEAGSNFNINWKIESEQAGDVYVVEKRTNLSEPFVEINRTKVTADHSSNEYAVKVPLTAGHSFYRIKIISANGVVSYSQTISSNSINRQMLRTFITGSNLMCKLPLGTTSVELFDAVGKTLLKQETDPAASVVNISLANIAKGVITVRALSNNEMQVARVLY